MIDQNGKKNVYKNLYKFALVKKCKNICLKVKIHHQKKKVTMI
jgi:hypothetical protein